MRKLFLLLIAFCLILTSCDQILPPEEDPQDQHVHTWDDGYFTIVPTCQTDIYYDGTSAQWATLFSSGKNILKGTDAIVHFTD